MSRRHTDIRLTPQHDHTIPDNIPFRSDLVLYAPMHEQCCCDYVHNVAPIVDTPHASAEWDTVEQAWKLFCEGNYNATEFFAALNYYNTPFFSGVGNDSIFSRGITIFMQRKNIAQSGTSGAWWWLSIDNGHTAYEDAPTAEIADIVPGCIALNLRASSVGDNYNVWCKFAVTMGSDGAVKWYRNGQNTASANWAANMKGEPHSLGVSQKRETALNSTAYAKDIRVYNRALTALEIAQL